jgi:hypothetical protein
MQYRQVNRSGSLDRSPQTPEERLASIRESVRELEHAAKVGSSRSEDQATTDTDKSKK